MSMTSSSSPAAGNVSAPRVFPSLGNRVGSPRSIRERKMRKLSMLLVPGLVSMALVAGPVLTSAYAAGSDEPSPPKADTSTKKKGKKSSSVSDPKFLAAYRTAYTSIYDGHDY